MDIVQSGALASLQHQSTASYFSVLALDCNLVQICNVVLLLKESQCLCVCGLELRVLSIKK